MFIVFDTETTGLVNDFSAPPTHSDNWPRVVQLAWQLHDYSGGLLSAHNYIIKPEGFTIPYNAVKIHGITTERAISEGVALQDALTAFEKDREQATYAVGHNLAFDMNVLAAEDHRLSRPFPIVEMKVLDTKDLSTDFCALPGGRGGKFKWPSLSELHLALYGKSFRDAHDAAYDVDATARCFFSLLERRTIKVSEVPEAANVRYQAPKLDAANFVKSVEVAPQILTDLQQQKQADISDIKNLPFAHLHCHTQFSILQSATSVKDLVKQARLKEMTAVAMTDHGNMMGAFNFVNECLNPKDGAKTLLPIVGCEFNLCPDRLDKTRQNNGYQTVLLAKNKQGYLNLAKLSSISYSEGFYYVPRIDKEVLVEYRSDIIATTGGLWGEVPYLILNVGERQAEEAFLWWKKVFGKDFYIELNRHGITEEDVVNETLLRFAKKHSVKYFAANNTYYSDKKDAATQDVLLCVRDAELVSKPKKYIGKTGREFRFGFPNDEFYIKSGDEMKQLFHDLPQAISCISDITGKIESYQLKSEVLLPQFDIPRNFEHDEDLLDGAKRGENAYLKHLAFEGAVKRYGTVTPEIRERLNFELHTIAHSGYPGYFLIVQDFCKVARERGVSVGPGRGSAAGSAVAYCIGITNVDPIHYDLLFERFLNPDRVSLPDIDIDFDDEGRQIVIDYVIKKYGASQVAQIITYGTMAAKSSVRDAGRVLDYPLSETNALAQLVPGLVGTSLDKIFKCTDEELREKYRDADLARVMELRKIPQSPGAKADVLAQARAIEGTVRNTGIHACGVIITPNDITMHVPVATAKDSDMVCTQFDNSVVENAGLLKMDFLGLKTLTLIRDAIAIIKEKYGVEIDPDTIDLTDQKTYALFQKGETIGIFQYESAGMQLYMKDLKPSSFDDLIAMNALFRPGPITYIPSFIRRKLGIEKIAYDLPAMEEFLKETYGITVYQEQVMLLSQKLAGFTKGEADVLRKAMGKKIFSLLDQLKPKFLDGCSANGHDRSIAEKIWKDWEAFASYAFNKSHSTCYALIAFHTAFLKAHYPAAYMASVLSNNMSDIKKVTFFMEECRRMGTAVLGPDVNESNLKFTVNNKDQIRFGLAAVKGVGENAVKSIIAERKENGSYSDLYDFVKRIDKRYLNKRCMENLVLSGALDCFVGFHRSQFFAKMPNEGLFIETLLKFGAALQDARNAPPDLFGNAFEIDVQNPEPPFAEPWSNVVRLNREKEVVGVYISAHPLDDYNLEIAHFSKGKVSDLKDLTRIKSSDLHLAGMVGGVEHRQTKNNNPFGTFEFEDKEDVHKIFLFSEDYLRLKHFLVPGSFLFLKGKVVDRKWSTNGELEFKISSIELLADLLEKNTKKVLIEMRLDDLDAPLLESLTGLVSSKKNGKSRPVEFRVVDTIKELSVKLPSQSMKIDLCDQTLKELDAIKGLKYEFKT